MTKSAFSTHMMSFTAVMWVIIFVYAAYVISAPVFFPPMTKGQFNYDVTLIVIPVSGIIVSVIGILLHAYGMLKKAETVYAGGFGIISATVHCVGYGYVVVGALYA